MNNKANMFGLFLFLALLPLQVHAYETTLASYLVDEDGELYDLITSTNLTGQQNLLAQDTETHEWMWDQFVGIGVEEFITENVSQFDIFVDTPEEDFLAYVVQDSWDMSKWIVSLDIEDMLEDLDYFNETLIHEFTHLLTLGVDQVDVAAVWSEWDLPDHEWYELYDEEVAACETYFTGEGCAHEDAYIYDFVLAFWQEIFDEHGAIDTNGDGIDFYTDNELDYVTWYAATNPGEDIAESFAYFVLEDEADETYVRGQKQNFVYEDAELVELRENIRAFLNITSDVADQIVEEKPEVTALIDRLAGQIMLMVDRDGEAWYIDPVTRLRYYLADGPTAYEFLRTFGLGITNADLAQIPSSDDPVGGGSLAEALSGRILLQVEERGEAWYVNPTDLKRYYLADGDAAYTIMRELSEGTLAEWIEDIASGSVQ